MAASTRNTMQVSLPSDREILLTRVFDAPRALVFEAYSKPEHVRHWWGPARFELTVCEMDFRPGGTWRFVQRDTDGTEHGFHGEYREIVAPERLVYTFEYEGAPGHVSVESITFDEHDGRTVATNVIVFDTPEARDATLRAGMESGAAETLDRLESYARNLR
jgi:uncharacterized protein YndB with AHSA1/START domain